MHETQETLNPKYLLNKCVCGGGCLVLVFHKPYVPMYNNNILRLEYLLFSLLKIR